MKLTGERPMRGRDPGLAARAARRGLSGGRRPPRPGRRGRRRLRHRRRRRERLAAPDRLVHRRRLQQRDGAARARPTSHAPDRRASVLRERRRRARPARPQRRLRRLVAHHRALREPGRCTSSSSRASLRADGTAFVITPNAPADFENPFHVYPFEPDAPRVAALAVLRRGHVPTASKATTCCKADFATRRASGERLLRLDVLRPPAEDAARARTCGRTSTSSRSPTASSATTAGIGSGIDRVALLRSATTCTPTRRSCSRSRGSPGRSRGERIPRRARSGSPSPPSTRSRTSTRSCTASVRRCRTRTSSSSTTTAPTAPPTRPRRSAPSSAGSRCCAGRTRWASAARTAPATRSASRAATTS